MISKTVSANQTGVLMFGPGGCRLEQLQSKMIPLTPEQYELVNRAKRYAAEQSFRHIMSRKAPSEQQQQQKSLQRYQALILMCRVYVGSISFDVQEEMIKNAFSPYGTIKSVNMSWDPITLKHKGFAFVEYDLPEAAQLALEHMNGIQVGSRQIKVGRPSNMPQAAPVIQQIQEECKQNNRIYVSNVHSSLNEHELAGLFEPFGRVRSCKLVMAPGVDVPQHRGCGFIEFETETAATEALTINNFDLGGTVLHVCRATTPAENVTIHGTLDSESQTATTASDEDIQAQLERTNREHDGCSGEKSHGITNGVSAKVSSVIVLKNMISADEDLDDSLHLELYEEFAKYGKVLQAVIYVDKRVKQPQADESTEPVYLDEVKIFVKYEDEPSSKRALDALNDRSFAGRKVSAVQYDSTAFRRHNYTL